jgi:membrane protein implicated in regulation of membrane protease activity
MMQRYSSLWWASILLSSVVTGGGSFALLTLLTELSIEIVIAVSLALILTGDVILALLMQAVSPTRVTLGPGDRRRNNDPPGEIGTVMADFVSGSGKVSIRGEQWRARQAPGCNGRLGAGTSVRVLEREGLTLVVSAAETR